MNVKIVNIS